MSKYAFHDYSPKEAGHRQPGNRKYFKTLELIKQNSIPSDKRRPLCAINTNENRDNDFTQSRKNAKEEKLKSNCPNRVLPQIRQPFATSRLRVSPLPCSRDRRMRNNPIGPINIRIACEQDAQRRRRAFCSNQLIKDRTDARAGRSPVTAGRRLVPHHPHNPP